MELSWIGIILGIVGLGIAIIALVVALQISKNQKDLFTETGENLEKKIDEIEAELIEAINTAVIDKKKADIPVGTEREIQWFVSGSRWENLKYRIRERIKKFLKNL